MVSAGAAAASAAETAASEGAKVAVGEVAAKGATTAVPQMSSTVANMSPAAAGAGNSLGGVIPSTAMGSSGDAITSGILSGATQGVAPVNLATVGADTGLKAGLSSDSYGWMGKLVGLGGDTGSSVGVTGGANKAATTAAGSAKDTIAAADAGLDMRDYVGIAGMGATAISSYEQGQATNKAALARNQIDINTYNANQARLDQQYKNANSPANFSMNIAEPTPEQLAANNKARLITPTIKV